MPLYHGSECDECGKKQDLPDSNESMPAGWIAAYNRPSTTYYEGTVPRARNEFRVFCSMVCLTGWATGRAEFSAPS